jgi:hypothetical protein
MRAISPIANYSIQFKAPREARHGLSPAPSSEYYDNKPCIAQFQRGGMTEWEQIARIESFDFSGLPDGVNPLTRVSVFDTEAYVESLTSRASEKARCSRRSTSA